MFNAEGDNLTSYFMDRLNIHFHALITTYKLPKNKIQPNYQNYYICQPGMHMFYKDIFGLQSLTTSSCTV